MNFAEFIFYEEIESLFAEIDLFEAGIDVASQSLRNRRLQKDMYIDPKTGSNWRAMNRWQQLEAVVRYEMKVNNTDINKIWINFSDTSKFGQRINIGQGKTTPVGIFGFPVKYAFKQKFNLGFQDRPYMHVFKTKKGHFEVGDNYKKSRAFDQIKSKFDFREKFSVVIEKFRDAYEIFRNEIEDWWSDTDLEQGLKDRILNWADDINWTVRSYFSNSAGIVSNNIAISKLKIELAPWFDNIENALPNFEKSKESYFKELQNATFPHQDSWIPIFVDIQPDGSAKLNPIYAGFLKMGVTKAENGKIYYHGIDVDDRLSVDQIIELSKKLYYETIASAASKFKYDQLLESNKGLRGLMIDYIKQLIEVIGKEEPEPQKPLEDLPYGKKLKKFANDNGLDYQSAVSAIMTNRDRPISNANQFLYRAVEQLAFQMSQSGRFGKIDYRAAWSRILKALGVAGIADTLDTGHVHGSELTQGVFFDPKDIVHITTIVQRGGSDHNDPANRPGPSNWEFSQKSHNRIISPANQRSRGLNYNYYDSKNLEKMGTLDRTYAGLTYRAKSISQGLLNLGPFGSLNGEAYDQLVTFLIKLSKSYAQLLKQDFRPSQDHTRSFERTVGLAISKLEATIRVSQYIDPRFLKKFEELKHIHNLNLDKDFTSVKTPTYKKSGLNLTINPAFEPSVPFKGVS